MSEFGADNSPRIEMNETDPAIIDTQIELGLSNREEGDKRPCTKNLYSNLHGGFIRRTVDTMGAIDRIMVEPDDASVMSGGLHYSHKARQTTWAQFFEDVDVAAAESGIDQAELDALAVGVTTDGMVDRLIPVYRALRMQGYSHWDLIR